jgi:hypothetical protein
MELVGDEQTHFGAMLLHASAFLLLPSALSEGRSTDPRLQYERPVFAITERSCSAVKRVMFRARFAFLRYIDCFNSVSKPFLRVSRLTRCAAERIVHLVMSERPQNGVRVTAPSVYSAAMLAILPTIVVGFVVILLPVLGLISPGCGTPF